MCPKEGGYMSVFNYVSELMQDYDGHYAFLSDLGCTNNVTIFIEEKDLLGLQKLLKSNGFRQGCFDSNWNCNYAGKKEIQRLKSYTGEIVSWIKFVENMPITIHIKICLRYMNPMENDDLIKKVLENAITYNYGKKIYRVLHPVDYFIYILFFSKEKENIQIQQITTFINEFYCKDFINDFKERILFLFKEKDNNEKNN